MLHAAPVGRHLCQLYPDRAVLAQSVASFVSAGLKRGDRVVVVAVPEHAAMILARLAEGGWSADAFAASSQLQLLDAEATLARFMHEGLPRWADFHRTMTPLASRPGMTVNGVRLYGDMVNVLWQRGNPQGAIRLEECWNDLAREHDLTLLCGYVMDDFGPDSHHEALPDIGRVHSDILVTDHDRRFQSAVDRACRDILGSTLSITLSLSGREDRPGEARLPIGKRSMLWLKRHMPNVYPRVRERALEYYPATQVSGTSRTLSG